VTPQVARALHRGRPHASIVGAARALGQVLARVLFRLTVTGGEHVPPHGPVLLASNHTGFLDGPLVFILSPRAPRVLAKSELFVGPLARALTWLDQIPVRRGTADRASLRAALDSLAAGRAVGVFPEGTRGAGRFEEVNDGLAYLAVRSGAPVVPVAILGTAAALPRGRKVPQWRAPVRVAFGAPHELTVVGEPHARRTVADAGEQLRTVLHAHLSAVARDHPELDPTNGVPRAPEQEHA
jgi:1-acyl-sn-glycerol-3-phosphate acyltransferase